MLYPLLKTKFSESIATWLCENWSLVDLRSLALIRYLTAVDKDNGMNYKMLLISSVADIGQADKFVLMSKMFLRYSKS